MTKRFFVALIGSLAAAPANASAPASPPRAAIVSVIEAHVAEMIAGINAKDISEATKFDAPDLVSMESMRPPSVGATLNSEGLAAAFKYAPHWRLRLIDQTVDVAKSEDMAVYRSTYHEDSERDGAAYTHEVNFLAGFARDGDGQWRIHWSVVCAQSASQKE